MLAMLDEYLDALSDQPEWQLVLHHYLQQEEAARQQIAATKPKRGRKAGSGADDVTASLSSATQSSSGTATLEAPEGSGGVGETDEEKTLNSPASLPMNRSGSPSGDDVSPVIPGESEGDSDSDEAGVGWSERVREVDGVPMARLVPIHGKLIALGHLNYLLQGRTAGILYRVSTTAKRLLQKCPLTPDELRAQLMGDIAGQSSDVENLEEVAARTSEAA
ncbi:MAG: hypothetical protein R3C01_04390 [Planctomycetaceae bacterium]